MKLTLVLIILLLVVFLGCSRRENFCGCGVKIDESFSNPQQYYDCVCGCKDANMRLGFCRCVNCPYQSGTFTSLKTPLSCPCGSVCGDPDSNSQNCKDNYYWIKPYDFPEKGYGCPCNRQKCMGCLWEPRRRPRLENGCIDCLEQFESNNNNSLNSPVMGIKPDLANAAGLRDISDYPPNQLSPGCQPSCEVADVNCEQNAYANNYQDPKWRNLRYYQPQEYSSDMPYNPDPWIPTNSGHMP